MYGKRFAFYLISGGVLSSALEVNRDREEKSFYEFQDLLYFCQTAGVQIFFFGWERITFWRFSDILVHFACIQFLPILAIRAREATEKYYLGASRVSLAYTTFYLT